VRKRCLRLGRRLIVLERWHRSGRLGSSYFVRRWRSRSLRWRCRSVRTESRNRRSQSRHQPGSKKSSRVVSSSYREGSRLHMWLQVTYLFCCVHLVQDRAAARRLGRDRGSDLDVGSVTWEEGESIAVGSTIEWRSVSAIKGRGA
jgi:hypothetical protein